MVLRNVIVGTGLLLICGQIVKAQNLDSLFFNLYTDSLKKGTYNYINVDGKYSNGRYLPLTDKDLIFTASAGSFEGNSLFIDSSVTDEKILVTVRLKSNPAVRRELYIYIKKYDPPVQLPTKEEVMPKNSRRRKKS